MKKKSFAFILLVALMAGSFAVTTAADCCIALFGAAFCYDAQTGTPSSGGGIGNPTPTPLPTPTPPHQWFLLSGISDGVYASWYADQCPNGSCTGGGSPDHHDFLSSQHSVDIDPSSCCPSVYYYDRSGSVATQLVHFQTSCVVGGGERVEIGLYSLDPPGKLQGTVAYLHLINAALSGNPTDGTFLGTINPHASDDPMCWQGPHTHEGIDSDGSGATVTHLTGSYNSGFNCQGWPYPEPTAVADPMIAPQQVRSGVPCYELSW